MVDIKQRSLQRPNYFTGQLLGEEDFKAEQQYHLDRSRRHLASLHTFGVDGLEVVKDGDRAVVVKPGVAIDSAGREIVLRDAQRLVVSDAASGDVVYVLIAYGEDFDAADRATDAENYTRRTEFAVLRTVTTVPPADGSVLVLARCEIDAVGRIAAVDTLVRSPLGARIAPRSVSTRELADGAVTRPKLHPSVRAGFVRLPFKPSSFIEAEPTARNFVIGVTKTYCDARGATGTMGIPVPPGAMRLKTVVVAGAINTKGIEIELYRCGWNTDGPEEGTKLPKEIPGGRSFFRQAFTLNWELNEDSHAIAIFVHAKGDAEISLIAAEFE
jgi:hypothetical protein